MQVQLPIFPMNAVVFPGVTVPLHVFEDRYRALVHHLLTISEKPERLFGIVAIREGYEVGSHGVQSVHRVGCVVQMTSVDPYPDGRFDIEVVGRRRLRLDALDTSGSYLVGDVETVDEPAQRRRRGRPRGAAHPRDLRGVPAAALGAARRRRPRRRPAPRPGAPLLQPGRHLPAHPAGAAGPAGGREPARPAGDAAARAARGDARDAGDPLAAGDRGRPDQLVPQLGTPVRGQEAGRWHAGDRGADQGRRRAHRAHLRPRPRRRVVRR